MNKQYLILLPQSLNRDEIIKKLQAENAISFWFYNLPSSFYVRSHLSSNQIVEVIKKHYNVERIMVIHIFKGLEYSGIVPQEHVRFFNDI
jgi:hypothetical protein